MPYKHTQIGWLILATVFACAGLFGFVISQQGIDLASLLILFFVTALLLSFSTLTVTVSGEMLQVKFGYGLYTKRLALKEILSVSRVKNHWYYGWGIRFWYRPPMWIFNVSGFDAVELRMKDGAIYRIGTDEPEQLEQALLHHMKQSSA